MRHLPHHRTVNPRRRIRLHSRPHIDLLRVAGALCRA
ncbi:putative leader peptide [Streptomyces sparsogenes]